MTRILPNFCVDLRIVCIVSFCVLFVCICVLYYCNRVATKLQLTNISYQNIVVVVVVVVVVAIVLPADILHFFTFKFLNKNILTFCFVNAGDGHFASSSLGSDNDENFLFSPDIRFSTDSCLRCSSSRVLNSSGDVL